LTAGELLSPIGGAAKANSRNRYEEPTNRTIEKAESITTKQVSAIIKNYNKSLSHD
jgi:hypothetical protein